MIPLNAMATDKLDIPYLHHDVFTTTQFLPAANCVQLKADNIISINRSILNILTIPDLRAVHIFQFHEGKTDWTIYDNRHSPLTINEVKGTMVFAIQQVKYGLSATVEPVKIKSQSFIRSTKTIIKHLEQFQPEDKILIVSVFKTHALTAGNYFDETTLCRALLNYEPRKSDRVIRKVSRSVVNRHSFSILEGAKNRQESCYKEGGKKKHF